MDPIKTGNFIAQMRKKQNLTQKQLADQINVSDKTVSKWETGYRMPDASILLALSAALQVNVNELLAGEAFSSEQFSPEEYMKKSERNIVGLVSELNEREQKHKSRSVGTIIGILLILLGFGSLLGTSLRMGRITDILDLPTLLYLVGLKIVILSVSGWFHDYCNSWRAFFPKKRDLTAKETENAIQATHYAGSLTLALGGLIASLSLFSLLNNMNDSVLIWPALAQIILTLFYTAITMTIYVILVFHWKQILRDGQDYLRGEKNGSFTGNEKSDKKIL